MIQETSMSNNLHSILDGIITEYNGEGPYIEKGIDSICNVIASSNDVSNDVYYIIEGTISTFINSEDKELAIDQAINNILTLV